ncbi:MAG: phosphate-starvation-inducible PsiE family protein [Candidatus Aureabacteria bacterium]|nr:phosphate-starvation-inducible PsiE family protein [Candidatus Auribacterota bacterium]
MQELIFKFEKLIVIVLLVLMIVTVLSSTLDLGWIIIKKLLEPPLLMLNIKEVLEIFGFFFMILIAIEILETIKSYVTGDRMHVEVVFLIAMIAVARKVIILDVDTMPPTVLLGIAAVIFALASGYYLVKYIHIKDGSFKDKSGLR